MRVITFTPLTPELTPDVRVSCMRNLRVALGGGDPTRVGLRDTRLLMESGRYECPDELVSQVCGILREHTSNVKVEEPIKGYLSGDGLLIPRAGVNPMRRSRDYQSRGRKTVFF